MQEENQSNLFKDIEIDHAVKERIRSMATWAMVVVAVAVIGYAITLLQLFGGKEKKVMRTEGFDFSMSFGTSGFAGGIITVLIGLLINYFLFRFASQARNGLDGLSQRQLNSSFNNLKVYFMATSIIMIIVFVIVLLSALVVGAKNV
jgi:hypothetical protein